MNAADSQPSLRPLGVGEVLDRAVTVCVKNFRLLATIFVVYAVPLEIAQFFAGRDITTILTKMQATIKAGAATGKPADPLVISHALQALPTAGAWYYALIVAAFFIAPLPAAALIDACANVYLGRATTFERAYRTALGAWPRLIVLNLLFLAAGIGLYIGFILLAIVVGLLIALVLAAAKVVGIVLTVLVVLALTIVGIAFAIVATLAWQVAYFTCVVEDAGPTTAFKAGLRRVFVGVGLRRSLLVGIAFFAIGVGIGLITVAGSATIVALVNNVFVGSVYSTIVQVATAAFTTAFIAIFYFDLRVREEGLDLQIDAANALARAVPTA